MRAPKKRIFASAYVQNLWAQRRCGKNSAGTQRGSASVLACASCAAFMRDIRKIQPAQDGGIPPSLRFRRFQCAFKRMHQINLGEFSNVQGFRPKTGSFAEIDIK